MIGRCCVVLAGAIATLSAARGQPGDGAAPLPYDYVAALYFGGSGQNDQALVVFPTSGKAVTIHLPFPLSQSAYSPDGMGFYALAFPPTTPFRRSEFYDGGLYRVEFNPTRTTLLLPGAALPRRISSMAVSARQDRIIISASDQPAGKPGCGIFEVALPNGPVRKIIDNPACGDSGWWHELSLSPDGRQAVAIREVSRKNGPLEVIDLDRATTKVIAAEGFGYVSWSPDGRWIAAVEDRSRYKTILFDTDGYTKRRTLPNSAAVWSPDSRYLLAVKDDLLCGLSYGYQETLAKIDVATGESTTVRGSRCKIIGEVGWVSGEILR